MRFFLVKKKYFIKIQLKKIRGFYLGGGFMTAAAVSMGSNVNYSYIVSHETLEEHRRLFLNAKTYRTFKDFIIADDSVVAFSDTVNETMDEETFKKTYGIKDKGRIKALFCSTSRGFEVMKEVARRKIEKVNLQSQAAEDLALAQRYRSLASAEAMKSKFYGKKVDELSKKEASIDRDLEALNKTKAALMKQSKTCEDQLAALSLEEAKHRAEIQASDERMKKIKSDAEAQRQAILAKAESDKKSVTDTIADIAAQARAKRAAQKNAAANASAKVSNPNSGKAPAPITASQYTKTGSPPKPAPTVTSIPSPSSKLNQ